MPPNNPEFTLARRARNQRSDRRSKVHFVGIGGIGMSSLAQWFVNDGWAVSGSDQNLSPITKDLKLWGIAIRRGHGERNIPQGTEVVIRSQAIRSTNPEIREANRRHIPVFTYPEIIGRITNLYRTIAIAGAHGKSTTTALVALVLRKAGFDPTVIVGTRVREFGGGNNFRPGKSEYLVLEADEYGGAFWHYSPMVALITNVDREHLDFYKNFSAIKKSFLRFIRCIRPGGTLIVNRDNDTLLSLERTIAAHCTKNKINLVWYSVDDSAFPLTALARTLKIPGAHNVSNACGVLALTRSLKIKDRIALSALSHYRGASRRLEFRGRFHGAPVYDDYAHHPTEIDATLEALKAKYPQKTLICVFQPHQAERLHRLFKEFCIAFEHANGVIIMPTYIVPGRDKNAPKGKTAKDLAHRLARHDPEKPIRYLPSPTRLPHILNEILPDVPRNDRVIVMMGAGNIVDYTKHLIQ